MVLASRFGQTSAGQEPQATNLVKQLMKNRLDIYTFLQQLERNSVYSLYTTLLNLGFIDAHFIYNI